MELFEASEKNELNRSIFFFVIINIRFSKIVDCRQKIMIVREIFLMDSGLRTKPRSHTKFHRNLLSSLEECDRQTDRRNH